MSEKYPFLSDKLALHEIRKHKWIESEKEDKELGFATAALDWINNHGEKWLKGRIKNRYPETDKSN